MGILMFASSGVAFASGGSGSGGGGTPGGGGSTAIIPQVAGTWNGQMTYDPSLAVFFPFGTSFNASWALVEDASGNITGIDNVMHVGITGSASGNGTIKLQDGTYYGFKDTMAVSSTSCSDGSIGKVMTGKFQDKEGFGVVTVNNCPVL